MKVFIFIFFLMFEASTALAFGKKLICKYDTVSAEASVQIDQKLGKVRWAMVGRAEEELNIIEVNEFYLKARNETSIVSIQNDSGLFAIALAAKNDSNELVAEYLTGTCVW
jgi:hypothetical protein